MSIIDNELEEKKQKIKNIYSQAVIGITKVGRERDAKIGNLLNNINYRSMNKILKEIKRT